MTNIRFTGAALTAVVVLGASAAFAADPSTGSAPASPPVRRIEVSIPDRKLALVENDAVVRVFDVAVGAAESPSPAGSFTIVSRVTNPTYYRPGKVIAPGATNPIGTRWIGLSEKGLGIHGTDDPKSIGHARSHGCIRLRNADVEKLFERVRGGDVVELHAERSPEIDSLFNAR